MEKGQFTHEEIFNQTKAWIGALEEVERKKQEIAKFISADYQQVIFTGCGSTYYLSLSMAWLFQSQTGMVCKAVPAGEILMNPDAVFTKKPTLLFALSRSGSTSETVRAVKLFKQDYPGKVISVSNYSDQPLPALADLPFNIKEGQEQSVAQTRSFSSMMMAATAITMHASRQEKLANDMRKLPEFGQSLMDKYNDFARSTGENLDVDRVYFLGSANRYGIACEGNLKMKEMTLTHSEPFHFLEFRHGPKSMVNEKAIIFGLLSDKNREYEEKVLKEMKDLGGHVVALAENNADVTFNSGLDEKIRTILYLPFLQMTAFYRSVAKGLNPDKPNNLSAVIYLD